MSIDSNLNDVDRDWSGLPLPPSPENMNHISELLPILDPNKRALQRLVTRTIHQDELPSVIATIVSNVKASDIVECLQESDAQTFVDIMDEACHHTIPSLRNQLIDLFQLSDFRRSGVG